MANNRLWIVDSETGERLLLAKSFGAGWYLWHKAEEVDEFFEGRDLAASYGNPEGPTKLRLETEHGGEG